MALLFSAVTLTGDDNQVELLVPGIPKESNDLRGWTAYENFIASIEPTTGIPFLSFPGCVASVK